MPLWGESVRGKKKLGMRSFVSHLIRGVSYLEGRPFVRRARQVNLTRLAEVKDTFEKETSQPRTVELVFSKLLGSSAA